MATTMSRITQTLQTLRLDDSAQARGPVNKCKLLELPAELRNNIWDCIVENEATEDNPIEIGAAGTPSFLAVCRQIRDEIRPMYHAKATFSYTDRGRITSDGKHLPLYRWLHSIKDKELGITRLILRFSDELPLGSVPLCPLREHDCAWHQDWVTRGSDPLEATEQVAEVAAERIHSIVVSAGVYIDTLEIEGTDSSLAGLLEPRDFHWWWKNAVTQQAFDLMEAQGLVNCVTTLKSDEDEEEF